MDKLIDDENKRIANMNLDVKQRIINKINRILHKRSEIDVSLLASFAYDTAIEEINEHRKSDKEIK